MIRTRREFLTRVGLAGGYSAAFSAMQALGFAPAPPAPTDLRLTPDSGKGTRVAILGAGIAGLVSAYELGKAGYQCTVLEARSRPGGRNWTIRAGTKVEFADGATQTADWEPENYLNPGPARIPSIHRAILGYCKELGVALEVEVNTSRSSLLLNDRAFGGKSVEQRQAINDTRGHVSELLAKCVRQGALDQELGPEDHERMLAFLRAYGDLGADYKYTGSSRAGAAVRAGAGPQSRQLRAPLAMRDLLDADFWSALLFEETLYMQATMFQPVGGMDRIPYAFAKKLGQAVEYDSPVKEIRQTGKGVRVVYERAGIEKSLEADYCICSMPITVLKSVPNDFSPRVRQAIQDTTYADAYKIGWESKRFWETDFNIYGGISWLTSGPITLVWYPSAKPFSETGVLISGFTLESANAFGKLPKMSDKLAASRAAVERLHPGYGKMLGKPIYVNWAKMPYSLGSWVDRTGNYQDTAYREFTEPDGPFFFAGDHCAQLGGWQEGAALSAHRAISMIHERVMAAKG